MNSITSQVALLMAIVVLEFGVSICNLQSAESFDSAADDVRVRIEVKIPDEGGSAKGPVEEVFIAGNIKQLGEWRPNGLRLDRAEGNVFYAEISMPAGSRVQFKVTRGSWQTVEKDKLGKDIPNREFVSTTSAEGAPQKFTIVVQRWGVPIAVQSTVTGTLKLHEKVGSKHLSRTRNVSVWLPPEYENSDQRYPVLHLQDGQNLFDVLTAAFGQEWGVDETAQDLIKKQEIPSIIIVGIWNTADRDDEYTLTKDDRLGRGGRGLDYIRFMTEELKPFIDATYRTQAERGSTIIGGSSLGGLIAIHACLQKPEVFGCCLAFSPTLGWDQERLLQSFQNGGKWPADVRLWFGMGTREGRDPELQKSSITRAQRLHQLLDQPHTNTPMQIRFQEFADATHNEKSWAIQFPVALKSMMAR